VQIAFRKLMIQMCSLLIIRTIVIIMMNYIIIIFMLIIIVIVVIIIIAYTVLLYSLLDTVVRAYVFLFVHRKEVLCDDI